MLKEVFGDSCEIVTILQGDQPVASVLNFYFRDEVLPYYGGGTRKRGQCAGNDFMYWEVMERARERGSRIFDYGRSKEAPVPSISRRTGASSPNRSYTSTSWSPQGDAGPEPHQSEVRQGHRAWRRLPLKITQLIGPPIAKYLG